MFALIFVGITVGLLALIFPSILRLYRSTKLIQKIPGPNTGLWNGIHRTTVDLTGNDRMKVFNKYYDEYKGFFRTWTGLEPIVFIGKPEVAEAIFTSRTNIDRSIGYKFLIPWLGRGLLTSTGRKWHTRRKMLTSAFHFSILNSFSETITENCQVLMKKLEKELDSDEFDLYPYLTNCALDIICQTAMGVTVSAQCGTSEYMNAVKQISATMTQREIDPWMWYDTLHYFSSNYKKQQKALQVVHGFTTSVIKRRKLERQAEKTAPKTEATAHGQKEKNAFLDLLLDMAEKADKPFTMSDIREEVDTFMFAGHDSSSSSTAYASYLLGWHPDIQEKVFQELYSVFGSSDRLPTANDIAQLKYLDCVIKESLRLYPAVPVIGRQLTEDVYLDGYKVPAGTALEINISQIHRNPDHYSEPDKFNPDNFLPENAAKRHPFAFVPFSAGPRNCIGQKFASLEEKILLSTLFRKYKVESLQSPEELMVEPDLVLRPKDGIRVRISRRQYPSD